MRLLHLLVVAGAIALPVAAHAQTPPDGETLYGRLCANCHENGVGRAQNRAAFRDMPAERVLAAMETGSMVTMANNRTAAERRALAEFVTGKSLSSPLVTTPAAKAMCAAGDSRFDAGSGARWSGWGHTSNSRFQENPGLTAADVPRLRLKWAFAFPGDLQSYAQATLAGGRLFTGSWGGKVYALDASRGCIHWYFDAGEGVRSAVTVGPVSAAAGARQAAFFGDAGAFVHALDAETGAPLWKVEVDAFPSARISGSPSLHDGRLYVPVASGEEGSAAAPAYECCRFRGSIVALDAATGRQLWKTYLVDEPRPTGRNAAGAQRWGPSGVPVWSTPLVDTRANALYVTTGNSYSDPVTPLSDAFVALDLQNGRVLWSKQMTPSDAYTAACRLPDKTNCAASNGPDFDFGASPILVSLGDGRRAIVAGEPSGFNCRFVRDTPGCDAMLWMPQ